MTNTNDTDTNNSGISFLGALTILFIGLKLTNNIDWDWLWVLSPLWIPFAIILAFWLITLGFIVIVSLIAITFNYFFPKPTLKELLDIQKRLEN